MSDSELAEVQRHFDAAFVAAAMLHVSVRKHCTAHDVERLGMLCRLANDVQPLLRALAAANARAELLDKAIFEIGLYADTCAEGPSEPEFSQFMNIAEMTRAARQAGLP